MAINSSSSSTLAKPLLAHSKPLLSLSLSPNHNKTLDLSVLINDTSQSQDLASITLPSNPQPLPHPPAFTVERFGVVDENGTMADEFEVGEFDPDVVENWGSGNEMEVVEGGGGGGGDGVVVKKFGLWPESMREYIPCLDNVEAIRRLKSTERGESGIVRKKVRASIAWFRRPRVTEAQSPG